MTLRDILLSQRQELENKLKENYIGRIAATIDVNSPLIKVITGPRRSGKSFFAMHFLHKKLPKFGYLNFDDERILETKDYDDIVGGINAVYNNPKHLLFDEIQNLPKWELFVNRLQRQGLNLIITGSNAKLLSKELATHLTGRHLIINIFPFSFAEYLKTDNRELTTSEITTKLTQYLLTGGYPEPLIKKIDYKEYLSMLINSIIYKDIIKRYKIRAVGGIEDLASYLISNVACETSFNRLSSISKVKSPHTVEKYTGYLEEAYLFFSLRKFSYKIREQITANRKIYAIDNGMIYAKAFQLSANFGMLYENVVACELLKKAYQTDSSIFYYKNAQSEEVDFVIKQGTKVRQLIQVCYDINKPTTNKRELRSLLKAGKELKCNDLVLINSDIEKTETVEWFGIKGKIKFLPLWKWLYADYPKRPVD